MRALSLEQSALPVEFGWIDACSQDADDDEGLRMRLHRAHDEVRVAGRDVLPVLLLQHLKRLVAVALAVRGISRLHLPVVDQVVVLVAVGGEAVAERILGLLQRLERIAEQGVLLEQRGAKRLFLLAGLLHRLGEELHAARIGPDDAEAAVRGLVLLVQRLEAGRHEGLPQLHLARIAQVLAAAHDADRVLDHVPALGPVVVAGAD